MTLRSDIMATRIEIRHRVMVTREMLVEIGDIGDCSKPVKIGRYRWWLMERPQFGYWSQIAFVDAVMFEDDVPLLGDVVFAKECKVPSWT
jgi:hypothetical protein